MNLLTELQLNGGSQERWWSLLINEGLEHELDVGAREAKHTPFCWQGESTDYIGVSFLLAFLSFKSQAAPLHWNPVDKDTILAIADHVKVWVVKEDLIVASRDEQ